MSSRAAHHVDVFACTAADELITRVARGCHQEPPARRGQPAGHQTDRLGRCPVCRTSGGMAAARLPALAFLIDIVPLGIGLRDISAALVGRSILATTTSRLAWLLA